MKTWNFLEACLWLTCPKILSCRFWAIGFATTICPKYSPSTKLSSLVFVMRNLRLWSGALFSFLTKKTFSLTMFWRICYWGVFRFIVLFRSVCLIDLMKVCLAWIIVHCCCFRWWFELPEAIFRIFRSGNSVGFEFCSCFKRFYAFNFNVTTFLAKNSFSWCTIYRENRTFWTVEVTCLS